ncbi:transcriptional regulator [Brachybacterium faecium DSM 4810]|uniref:Transcriptional regulator n=1 Tax=Brachybacterium faecium (strain ATCC 43885 / DSM 4810 / JCM 11609 / LMG 19847 / NBRC 14762 / NCIMB 9860 / 6-10) TaxID=446465 RepID=C7MHF4_BRAFD|nr:LacI family DNA-binding transcriptional regulator [Brachybacterium faecium]ACU84363.1 transcriptional regulator [Brachybacterium faecium DSM 4810]
MSSSRRATIGDVARRAGVSKATVSLAYSGKRPVSEATRQRIFEAAEDLEWTASESARALAMSRTATIGLVLARSPEVISTDPFFPRFIAGCESVLAEAGMGLLLSVVATEEDETAIYRRYATGRVDGVILLDVQTGDRRPALMRELGLPAVLLAPSPAAAGLDDAGFDNVGDKSEDEVETTAFPVVLAENAPAIRDLVSLLVEAGHRRIAHVSGPLRYVHATERRNAFEAAMLEHGLDPSLVVDGDFTAASGRSRTLELLDREPRPTAIVYANDVMAIAGLSLARSRGLLIPEQLSLTGFDDSDLAAHLSPGLSSVSTRADEVGATTARTLLATLAGVAVPITRVDGPTVIARGSIGPPSDLD